MTGRRISALLVSMLLGSLAWSGALSPASANASLGGDPGYHQPPVGACYDLTADELDRASSTEAAVPCDGLHSTVTVKVKRLTAPVRWYSPELVIRFGTACQKAVYEALGGNIKKAAMSAYDWWYFIPTRAEREAGARWVRCDVGLRHAGADELDDLPESLVLPGLPLPDEYARCLVGDNLNTTQCTYRHQYKAKATFKLDRRPATQEQLYRAGARCSRILGGVNNYAFFGPGLFEWRAGNHLMVCFKRHS